MLSNATIPIVGFVAPSGTGKTQLLKALIADLKAKGIRVGAIKHSHHNFEIDKPGKDSYELRMAGAEQMLIASKHRWAMVTEKNPDLEEPTLDKLLSQINQSELDIIFVEGFKSEKFDKIEVFRSELEQQPLYVSDPNIIAVASDVPVAQNQSVAQLDINNIPQITQFILQHYAIANTSF